MPDPAPTYWEQPELNQTATEGANTATRNFKGDFADLLTFANGLTIGGSPYGGLPLRAVNITRTVASLATLRLEYGKETSYDSQKTATETSVNWSVKHTQRIVSLMRRTGDSASMPHRGNLEAWRKEPDPALYDAYQYRNQVGSVLTLSLPEQAVAAKLKAGTEGAMRFYPTIQKVTVYSNGKISNVGQGLATIDTPGSPWDSITIGGASAVWLKVGDDVTKNKDGQTRTESWMGAKSWDVNLYGTGADRWTELD
jgi:hypothetical protein